MRPDLRAHRLMGFAAGILPAVIVGNLTGWWLAGSIVGGFVGAAKEWLWDARGKGTVDPKDYAYTQLGGMIADVVAFAGWALVHWS